MRSIFDIKASEFIFLVHQFTFEEICRMYNCSTNQFNKAFTHYTSIMEEVKEEKQNITMEIAMFDNYEIHKTEGAWMNSPERKAYSQYKQISEL